MKKRRRSARRLLAIALSLCVLAPRAALGQRVDPQRALAARALHDQAVAEMDAKSYASACPKLEEATRILPDALGVKLTLAECYVGLGKLASAWSIYSEVAELAAKAGEAERAKAAQENASALRPSLAMLVVEVPKDVRSTPGLAITRDGVPLSEPLWGAPVPADVGEHQIVATAPDRISWKGKVVVKEAGARVSIAVLPLAAAPKERGPEQAAAGAWMRPLGIVALSLGGAGVAAGAVMGGLAIQKHNQSNRDNACDALNRCDEAGLDLRRQAIVFGNASTAAIVAGAAVATVGVVLVAAGPGSPKKEQAASAKGAGPRLAMGIDVSLGRIAIKAVW